MSFLGKLRNAVLGNTVMREYELGKQVASAGPGLVWKVYAGVKKSNRQEVAIFVFNKQTPEFEKLSKRHRDTLVEVLKRGPTQLAKLRHPKLLTIDHPLEDSADSIAFATEPITASLANLLGHHDNLPTPVPSTIKDYDLRPIEIQYGLMEIAEALTFLHDDVHMLHGNLSPESIVLAKSGSWKLMGFEFSSYTQPQGDSLSVPEPPEWDSRNHTLANPRLEYLAPEYIINRARSEPSDFYSYGMMIYACYNGGRTLFDCQNNVTMFKQYAEQVSRVTETALGNVPAEFKVLVRSTLSIDPSVRPDAQQIVKHPFFEEVGANTLKYLDTLVEKTDMEKSQFFKKSLPRVITKLPKRVVNQRVLPALAGEFKNHKMIPFLLPLIFLLAEDYSAQEYTNLLWPILVPVFLVQDPVQVPIILLQRMDLLLKKTSQEDVKKQIIPMILRAMEGGTSTSNTQLQELCVSILPTFAGMMDYSSLKHSIVPRLVTTCGAETTSLGLLVKCLVALGKMLDHFDKMILVDQVIPMLEKVKSREPAVLMAILGIYHETVKNKKLGLDKNLLGTKIVPFLIPLAMEPVLKLSQFNQFMIVIEEMLLKVVTEQRAHLEQLAAMEQQTESTVAFSQEVTEAKAMDDALDKISSMSASKPPEPLGAIPVLSKAGPLEVDDFFSLSEVASSTRPMSSPSSGQPLVPKPATRSPSLQPSLQPVTMAPSLQPVTMAPSLQPVTMAPSLQPVTMAPSLQPVTMAPSLQPVTMAPSLQPVTMAPLQAHVGGSGMLTYDADFGPIEWSSASQQQQQQPLSVAQQPLNVAQQPLQAAWSTGQYMQPPEDHRQSSHVGKGLFSGMEPAGVSGQPQSFMSVPSSSDTNVKQGMMGGASNMMGGASNMMGGATNMMGGASNMMGGASNMMGGASNMMGGATNMMGGATNTGQSNSSLFGAMDTRAPPPEATTAAGGMSWSGSGQSSFSNQFSSAPQTGQVYPPLQAMGFQGEQQYGVPKSTSTVRLEPTARPLPGLGQPLVPVPAQGSQQSQQNAMGWSSGGSAQSSTPLQPQVPMPQNGMGWSSGGSAQSSTPLQPQVPMPKNVMGWSSGSSAQSSTPQQPQVTTPQNGMGWSSGGSTQSSTPQRSQVTTPQNGMGWSSGVQQSQMQPVQPSNPMVWSSLSGPLQPTQQTGMAIGSSVPSAQTQQRPPAQTGQMSNQRPPPPARDNPFADFIA